MTVRTAMSPEVFDLLFDDARLSRLRALSPSTRLAIDDGDLSDTEILVTSWGAPRLDAELLDRMPRLRAVVHAAGSVQQLVSDELWERGITVTSAADANAVPVAEYTFATIILAFKRAFVHMRSPSTVLEWRDLVGSTRYGSVGRTVGIVGFSRIGRRVVRMLGQLDGIRILVADPFVSPQAVADAGAELLPLDEMLDQVDVLSLHAPALPETRHMIGAAELAALHDGATVINTARGWILDHDALLAECAAGRLDAVLDVTEPDPLPTDSPLRTLPNVALTPHIAGSMGNEARRLADSALDDVEALLRGGVPSQVITRLDMELSA
ncbi:phosphoglycerate dehydrogenase-like enzyme [Microbacterium phyllosphaerae]|uniref:Phosphoglycerate dehydrogenase-like enzyme n=1 Tax=Microbacterium phyllosphaerae TaxID=124798 RepID=A0ABS4WUU3_9MICO|nr:hydroxyacid dehydrogenase [Microbacterium phyllosphaerae]MBP2379969.1 phosphoglycerate dehydrogenase-like enzyme [Microbacterium phyllosphaerae]